MAAFFVADFGTDKKGITTYRINGKKDDLEEIIKEVRTLGCEFWEQPILEKTHKQWSVLLKVLLPKNLI